MVFLLCIFTISLRRSDSIASHGSDAVPSTILCWAITVSIPLFLFSFTWQYAVMNAIALPRGPSIHVAANRPRWLLAMCVAWFVRWRWIHWQLTRSHARTKMTQSNPQAIDYLYPTTNTPSLTIHHALIVCEAVHRVCPWDDERDAKENDCQTNLAGNSCEMWWY